MEELEEFSEKEEYAHEEDETPIRVYESRTLSTYDLTNCKQKSSSEMENIIGTFMPLDSQTIVSFFEYPKIISLRNVIVHGYDIVDQDVLWDFAKERVPELLEKVLNY